jgi:tetratricopeptide (TPR) repeat protein
VPPPSPGVPAQLFYSYSHKDEKLRDQLETHLSTLKRENRISAWHDRRITAGTEWKGEIDEHLKSSSVILLLVTANFLASDYCHDIELRYAMEQHEKSNARVIPVILRPCDWKTTIFAKLQALPTDGKPVIDWKTRDNAFLNVVEGIRKALDELGHGGSLSSFEKTPVAIPHPVLNALHQLPTPPADFTGRAGELKELLQAVKTGGVTISGLQGLSGVGKTALALKLAEQLKPDYPDAQFYLDLKGVSLQPLTTRDAMAYVVRAWHPRAQLPEKEEEVAALYRSVLEGKRALLLMDNARDAQQVAPIIPPVGCLLLVTSRKHFALPGLFEKNLDKLAPNDARDLLLRIAARLKKEKPEQVDELARICGYLPLALRAVASALQTTKNISLADCVRNMADRRKRLKLTEADAALQSSYELLSDDLRQKFRFLSVFPDSFDLPGAAALWELPLEDAQDALSELLAYSLIEFDEISKRYGLHDLVRLFANQLLDDEKRYTVLKRHAGHYLEVMRAADALYKKGGESMTQGLALFDAEWTNIQAGQAWVAEHHLDDNQAGTWCCTYPFAAADCLDLRQHARERIQWLEPALAASRHLERVDAEGASLANMAKAYQDMGEARRAIKYHDEALNIYRTLGDREREGRVLGNLGNAYVMLGDYRHAVECQEQRLEIARKMDDRLGESQALTNLGIAYHAQGEYYPSINYLEQSLQLKREIGERRGESRVLGNLSNGYLRLGECRKAIEYQEQALKIIREVGDRWSEGAALGNLGLAYRALGEYRRAPAFLQQAFQVARETGNREGEANSLFNSALCLDDMGDRQAAISSAEAALKIYESIESPHASKARDKSARWREEDKASSQGRAE